VGELIRLANNGSHAGGYLARPAGPGPGVIVIQEWRGLVPYIGPLKAHPDVAGVTILACFRRELKA